MQDHNDEKEKPSLMPATASTASSPPLSPCYDLTHRCRLCTNKIVN